MRNLQQNLFVALASALCGLCAWQWYGQTVQRRQVDELTQAVYEKSTVIQNYTNSLRTVEAQLADMNARVAEYKEGARSNAQQVVTQERELRKLRQSNDASNRQIAEYQKAVEALQAQFKDVGEGVKKQNEAMKQLIAERDAYAQKFADSMKDRNQVVADYNALVARYDKLLTNSVKASK